MKKLFLLLFLALNISAYSGDTTTVLPKDQIVSVMDSSGHDLDWKNDSVKSDSASQGTNSEKPDTGNGGGKGWLWVVGIAIIEVAARAIPGMATPLGLLAQLLTAVHEKLPNNKGKKN